MSEDSHNSTVVEESSVGKRTSVPADVYLFSSVTAGCAVTIERVDVEEPDKRQKIETDPAMLVTGGLAVTAESEDGAVRGGCASGFRGVYATGSTRWKAQASKNGKQHHLGTFLCKEDAAAAVNSFVSFGQKGSTGRKPPASGFRGVTKAGERWQARATKDGRQRHLGLFSTAKEAAVAVQRFEKRKIATKANNLPPANFKNIVQFNDKWKAFYWVDGKKVYLGLYETDAAAELAVTAAATSLSTDGGKRLSTTLSPAFGATTTTAAGKANDGPGTSTDTTKRSRKSTPSFKQQQQQQLLQLQQLQQLQAAQANFKQYQQQQQHVKTEEGMTLPLELGVAPATATSVFDNLATSPSARGGYNLGLLEAAAAQLEQMSSA